MKGPWVTPTSIFWEDQSSNPAVLRRIGRNGGSISSPHVATGVGLYNFRLDRDVLYFLDGQQVLKISSGTVMPEVVYANLSPCLVFDVEETSLYCLNASRQLLTGSVTGAALSIAYASFIPLACEVADLRVTTNAVYGFGRCSDDTGYVVRFDRNTGQRTTLLSGNASIKAARYLVTSTDTVLFADTGGNPYTVYAMPAAVGAQAKLLLSNGPFLGLAVESTFVNAWRLANTGNDGAAFVRFALP